MPRARAGAPPQAESTTSSQRRAEIVGIAADLFAAQGIQATTVRQIGDRAGILSGSLYHHFSSKLDIVDTILAEFCAQILALYREQATDDHGTVSAFSHMVASTVEIMGAHTAAVRLIQAETRYLRTEDRFGYILDFLRESEATWITLLERGAKEGVFRSDLDPQLHYHLISSTIAGCVERVEGASAATTRKAVDALVKLLLHGIA
jgi:AcrR family transcriptional regulator